MARARIRAAACLAVAALLASGCITTQRGEEEASATRKAASHMALGVDHLSNGRSALALREFLAAETLDPKNPRVHYALGEAFLVRGKRVESEKHLRRAVALHAGHHDARLSLAALMLAERRYDEAIAECETLIDDPTFPNPWRALTNRAWAEHKLGRSEDAKRSIELALEYRAEYWPATLALAIVENETGRRLEAVRLLRDIIALSPGPGVESEVNYRLAEIYVALGKRREAMGHLTASVARAPDGPWAKKSQEYLRLLH